MPGFDTPTPIDVLIDLAVGDVRVTAADRPDTVVDVRPTDPRTTLDVDAAEQTRVEYADGRLVVKAPKQRNLGLFGKPGSIDVEIALPTGSALTVQAAIASVDTSGRLGACRIKTAVGDVHVDETGPLDLQTSSGSVSVGAVTGDASVSTSTGALRVGRVHGGAVLKNSDGESRIGEVTGDLRVQSANGSVLVDRAGADVTATTAKGDVRIGAVTTGSVSLKTSMGDLEVGVPEGTAAHLDVHTGFGNLVNRLTAGAGPAAGATTVELRARTSYGDIIIRRP